MSAVEKVRKKEEKGEKMTGNLSKGIRKHDRKND